MQVEPSGPLVYVDTHYKNARERRLLDQAIEKRDGAGCFYCCEVPRFRLHVDHVVPRAYGGSDELGNLVHACETCNLRKGRRPGWFFVVKSLAPRLPDRAPDLLLDVERYDLADFCVGGRFGGRAA